MPVTAEQQQKMMVLLQDKAFGKPSYDGSGFEDSHTEINVFSQLNFIEADGKLEADIRESVDYQNYYFGSEIQSLIELELRKLADALEMKLDATSNFHGKISISDQNSIAILKNAGVTKQQVQQCVHEKKQHENEVNKKDISDTSKSFGNATNFYQPANRAPLQIINSNQLATFPNFK